jgi:hypothetical protein
MSGFSNPVANAVGTLIRTVMKSINYVTNVSGWAIFKNGNAEFNSGTFRGSVIVGGAVQQIIIGGASTIPAALTAYYAAQTPSAVVISGIIMYQDPSNYIYDVLVDPSSGDSYRAVGTILSGSVVEEYRINPGTQIWGGSGGNPTAATVVFNSGVFIDALAKPVPVPKTFQIDGIGAARGIRKANVSVGGTVVTTVAGAEIAVPSVQWLWEPSYNFYDDHLYKATIMGGCYESATVTGQATVRVRQGTQSITGTQLVAFRQTVPAVGGSVPTMESTGYFKNTSGATVATKLSLTVQKIISAGNFSLYGDANFPLMVVIEDVGTVTTNPELADGCPSVI